MRHFFVICALLAAAVAYGQNYTGGNADARQLSEDAVHSKGQAAMQAMLAVREGKTSDSVAFYDAYIQELNTRFPVAGAKTRERNIIGKMSMLNRVFMYSTSTELLERGKALLATMDANGQLADLSKYGTYQPKRARMHNMVLNDALTTANLEAHLEAISTLKTHGAFAKHLLMKIGNGVGTSAVVEQINNPTMARRAVQAIIFADEGNFSTTSTAVLQAIMQKSIEKGWSNAIYHTLFAYWYRGEYEAGLAAALAQPEYEGLSLLHQQSGTDLWSRYFVVRFLVALGRTDEATTHAQAIVRDYPESAHGLSLARRYGDGR